MTSDTVFLGDYAPGEPTDPMVSTALAGVYFYRRDLSEMPTLRVPIAREGAASRIHETPTRKQTCVIFPAVRNASGLPARRATPPANFVTGTLAPAMCGHETLTPVWEDGHSACPSCFAKAHCRADGCRGVPIWGDRCGYWWCSEHEGGAVLMTLGGDLGYPTLDVCQEGVTVTRARENWLAFARTACLHRHDLLRAALLAATRARLLRPGEERGPALSEVVTGDGGEVAP